jgi:deoxyribose-phosphate aldolase
MNTKKMIAALALSTLAGSVFAAGQNEFVDYTNVKTEKTRTEVRAELAEANAQGQVTHAPEFVETARVASTKSRDEVRKEATQSAKAVERNTSFVNYGA